MDLKYLLEKISPNLISFYRKYKGTLRHKIHYTSISEEFSEGINIDDAELAKYGGFFGCDFKLRRTFQKRIARK